MPPGVDSPREILAPLVLGQVGRALALVDASPVSDTYGCGDRDYWYYRTLTNFAGATWQQSMLALAAIYQADDATSPHARDPRILEASASMLSFWARAGHRDGAYDEWYLNEHSYCPTAITGAGAALTLNLIGTELSEARRMEAIEALRRAGHWLTDRYNPTVLNQNLAAAVALAALAKLDDASLWRERAEAKLNRIAGDQHSEGWFPEYEGADLGYSTLALDLLASHHQLTGSDLVLAMARKLCAFLARVQGGWPAMAGRLGSRGTSHVFPFGALYFAAMDENARGLAGAWLQGLRDKVAPAPNGVDDRYFSYFYLPQFALAYRQSVQAPALKGGIARPGVADLSSSGFVTVQRQGWAALISRRLGGAVAVSNASGRLTYQCGYEISTSQGGRYSSATWDKAGALEAIGGGGEITVDAPFRAASAGLPLTRLMAPFQIAVGFLATSGLAEMFQSAVKSKMIAPTSQCGLTLQRQIKIEDAGLRIRDTLVPSAGLSVRAMSVAHSISMHSPSARQDVANIPAIGEAALTTIREGLNAGRSVRLSMTIEGASGETRLESIG